MSRVRDEKDPLFIAMQKSKIPQVIISYLKSQQAKNPEFFNLYISKKINGRLFYNTCQPNGSKEVRLGNEDFIKDEIKHVIDDMLAPFNSVTPIQVTYEFVQPSQVSENMNHVIARILGYLESSTEWKKFWKKEINLNCDDIQKQRLYNLIATHAAYKVLVSCVEYSRYILDPLLKRNITMLIGICTERYQKPGTAMQSKKSTRKKKETI